MKQGNFDIILFTLYDVNTYIYYNENVDIFL